METSENAVEIEVALLFVNVVNAIVDKYDLPRDEVQKFAEQAMSEFIAQRHDSKQ